MKTTNLFCIIVTALFFAVVYPATSAELKLTDDKIATDPKSKLSILESLSVETLGVMRSINIGDGEQYGVGLDVGLKLSAPVTLHFRGVSYHDPDQWRGAAIDEASVLVEARLFASEHGRLTLSALAGGDYNVDPEDFGFSAGGRVAFKLTDNLSIVGDSRIRAWFNEVDKDIITTAGLKLSF